MKDDFDIYLSVKSIAIFYLTLNFLDYFPFIPKYSKQEDKYR